MKLIAVLFIMCGFVSSSIFAAGSISLKQKIDKLGDDRITVSKANCDFNDDFADCNYTPYDHQTVWWTLSSVEKKARNARNNARRNEWLRTKSPERDSWMKSKGVIEYKVDIKEQKIKNEKRALAAELKKVKKSQKSMEDKYLKNINTVTRLKLEQTNLNKSKMKLTGSIQDKFLGNSDLAAGDSGIVEDATTLFTGKGWTSNPKKMSKELRSLESERKELRSVNLRIKNAQKEAKKRELEAKKQLDAIAALSAKAEKQNIKLVEVSDNYNKALVSLGTEREIEAYELSQMALADSKNETETKLNAFMDDLKDGADLAEFVMKDYASLGQDLKIRQLEVGLLLQRVNTQIDNSVLGRYIAEKMEQTLEAAINGACQSAKLCAGHESINDSNSKELKTIIDKSVIELKKKETQVKR